MDSPNPPHEKRSRLTIKYPFTTPEIQQWAMFPASSTHLNDLARENFTPSQIPRVTQTGSQTVQTTTTARGCIPSIGANQALSHTHVVVCNSQACTDQVTTNTQRHFLSDPVDIPKNVINAQHSTQNTLPTQQEKQQPFPRLRIQRDLRIGDCCYAKYFEDGLFYSARIVDIHPSANTAVVIYDDYDEPEEVIAEDILPESPPIRRLSSHSSSREQRADPPSQSQPYSQPDISFKRYKAFKLLMSDTSHTYNGSNYMEYKPW